MLKDIQDMFIKIKAIKTECVLILFGFLVTAPKLNISSV